ncbi:hypothetical protein J6590_055887 [Homalodisca vitripennis]|nr:hypothetical protein J6590_055887 [Homalodisca vitripennis]
MKLQVPADNSVTLQGVEEGIIESTTKPSSSKKTNKRIDYSSDDDDGVDKVLESDGESETFSNLEEILLEQSSKTGTCHKEEKNNKSLTPKIMPLILLLLLNIMVNQKYPGKMFSLTDKDPSVEYMEKRLKFWRWPERQGCLTYEWNKVCGKIKAAFTLETKHVLFPV